MAEVLTNPIASELPGSCGPASFSEEEEDVFYGELVVIGKDKSEGTAYDIYDDVTIGRDKGSDIRIALKTVSRVHAKITIDVDGRCVLTNYSKTNPVILNGTALEDKDSSTMLEHGDIFTVAERDFMYKNEELLFSNQQGAKNADEQAKGRPKKRTNERTEKQTNE